MIERPEAPYHKEDKAGFIHPITVRLILDVGMGLSQPDY